MPPALAEKMLTTVAADAPQFWDFDQFVSRFESYPELIPCLRDFDFDDEDWRHDAKNVHYVEPMVTRPAVTALQVTIPTGKSLIYACAGSQVQDYEGRAREFFISLINMMQTTNMGSYHLVLAVGSKLLAELLLKYPKEKQTNFTLCDWVAQPEIMGESNTAAVFVHGGLATIKEAISAGVPMVIVPHGKDQLDNALRVTRKGLGLVAQLEETSALGLRKLLTAVTASSSIANNLSAMRAAFETAEGEVAGKKTAASEKVCVKLIADVLAGDPPTKTS
jgi:UDP:flavonoid glycosyltransferase YjiC (YdhE family)